MRSGFSLGLQLGALPDLVLMLSVRDKVGGQGERGNMRVVSEAEVWAKIYGHWVYGNRHGSLAACTVSSGCNAVHCTGSSLRDGTCRRSRRLRLFSETGCEPTG